MSELWICTTRRAVSRVTAANGGGWAGVLSGDGRLSDDGGLSEDGPGSGGGSGSGDGRASDGLGSRDGRAPDDGPASGDGRQSDGQASDDGRAPGGRAPGTRGAETDVRGRAADGGVSQPWVNAQQRWSEAAELLRAAGRAPVDLQEWLGSSWTGDAADKFGQWGTQFADATRRASAALTDAAANAAAISTRGPDAAQYLLPQADLDALDDGVRRISAVLVPGQRTTGPRQRVVPRRPGPGPQQRPGRRPGAGGVTFPPDRHARVQGWIDQATDILHQQGYTDDQIDRDAIATIIRYESNGNPSAVNGGDSNAASGNHSRGLMQTIPPTFRHYALPGHTHILNPVDNIIAGVRYAVDRYGSVSKVPGVMAVAAGRRYVGY